MKVLITGGAGYIGSTVASACIDAGISPVILDNLVTGRREFVRGREFYEGDIADGSMIDKVFGEHPDIDAVVHCAALIVVPESVADPVRYLPGEGEAFLARCQETLARAGRPTLSLRGSWEERTALAVKSVTALLA